MTEEELDLKPDLIAKNEETFLEKRFNELRLQRIERQENPDKYARSLKLTTSDIAFALRRSRGNLLKAAEFLGIRRHLLKQKIEAAPILQRLQQHLTEEALDLAEWKLLELIDDGYYPAISLYLKTQGKERGYTEKVTTEYEMGENATKTAAALIEAMQQGVEEVKSIDVKEYHVEG